MAEGLVTLGSEMSIVNNQSIMDQCRKENPPAPGPVCHCEVSLPGFISSLQTLCPGYPGVYIGFGWDPGQNLTCSQSHIGFPMQEWGFPLLEPAPRILAGVKHVSRMSPGQDLISVSQ